jgi:hypothetical protein
MEERADHESLWLGFPTYNRIVYISHIPLMKDTIKGGDESEIFEAHDAFRILQTRNPPIMIRLDYYLTSPFEFYRQKKEIKVL